QGQRNQLSKNASRVSEPGEIWPPKTGLAEMEEYTFACRVNDGQDSEAVLAVHYWDYAGDLMELDSRESRELVRRLKQVTDIADVLLLTVDGQVLLQAMLGSEAFDADPGDAEPALRRSVANLVQVAMTDNNRIAHLLVTKWDLFESRGLTLPDVRRY